MGARSIVRSIQWGIFSLSLMVAPASHAILIEYQAVDLADVTVGTDLWQYNYYVSDQNFLADQGFTIWFDLGTYSDLVALTPVSNEWDVFAAQPDPLLPDAGYFDALALVDSAALGDPFSVQFTWLGGGAPGTQAFDYYDFSSGRLVVLESGFTVPRDMIPVTEPDSVWLLLAGATAWWLRRRPVGTTPN